MASLSDIRAERLEKLEKLKSAGMDPYPVESGLTATVEKILDKFSTWEKEKKEISVGGRVMAIRGQGAIMFVDLDDGTSKIQAVIKKGDIPADKVELFADTVDIGDFIKVTGSLFVTKRSEKSILATDWAMLSKSLRPLPDKWHGLKDPDERFRRRYLDSLMDETVKSRFLTRAKIISEFRKTLDKAGYIEVETPILQPQAGGATAKPFSTHHNALDIDLFLRIAPELYLKRMLVGGFPKVYEIGRNFRNEGIDVTHNPEFTMLEFYGAYEDAKNQRKFVEKMLRDLVKSLTGGTEIESGGEKIDFGPKFKTVSYFDLIKRYALIQEPEFATADELVLKAKQLGVDLEKGDNKNKILDKIYKKTCRSKLIQPTFIIDYPLDMLPLAKQKTGDEEIVDAFQLVVAGVELVKAFSELNDPIDQAKRFKAQEKDRDAGDDEAQETDVDYIEAMEYGLPPAGGVGIGIDRLMMVLTDTQNIREVIYFPTLRPRE